VVREIWTAFSIHSPVLCWPGTMERGGLERAQFMSRTVAIISTGGIVDEADEVEPHGTPNRAGRWTRHAELRGFFHWAGWRAHAEARVSVASHAEWCRCGKSLHNKLS
jgi:hypothetical protein